MNKEKEIEEMTGAAMCAMEYREKIGTPNFELIAQNLINAGYGNVKQYQNEIKQLKSKIAKLEEFYKIVQSYYEDLDSLAKRLQDDYNGEKSFEQEESDRLGICYILDHIDEMGRLD